MGDCPILKEDSIGAHLAGASVTKTATLIAVLRVAVSKVMSACMNHGETTLAKRNSEQKLTLTERDRRTLRRFISKSHRTTAAQVNCSRTEYSVSTKTVRCELPAFTVGLQLLNL
jgi:hypothetical protein